jgi:hypothetical protein
MQIYSLGQIDMLYGAPLMYRFVVETDNWTEAFLRFVQRDVTQLYELYRHVISSLRCLRGVPHPAIA